MGNIENDPVGSSATPISSSNTSLRTCPDTELPPSSLFPCLPPKRHFRAKRASSPPASPTAPTHEDEETVTLEQTVWAEIEPYEDLKADMAQFLEQLREESARACVRLQACEDKEGRQEEVAQVERTLRRTFRSTYRQLLLRFSCVARHRSLGNTQKSGNSRPIFDARVTAVLKRWFHAHIQDPYPCADTKQALANETGLSYDQVQQWYVNTRNRVWRPELRKRQRRRTKQQK